MKPLKQARSDSIRRPDHFGHVLTSAGVGQFGPAEEAQVSGPSPDGLRVSEAESGAEMVRLQGLVSVDGEVTAGVVAAVHPDLRTHRDISCYTTWKLSSWSHDLVSGLKKKVIGS